MTPRPDQYAAHDAVVSALDDAGIRRPLCVAPMAWGKSWLIAMLAITLRAGEITALVGANIFTEGFDATRIDLVAFLRATASPVLWVQSAGRGMRLHPGKIDCRLLDFGNNLRRHGPIDGVVLRKSGERHDTDRGADQVRVCPVCDEVNPGTALVCACCEEQLVKPTKREAIPAPDRPAARNHDDKLEQRESELAALGGGAGRWAQVYGVTARIHEKAGSPPCLRIVYSTDAGSISEFLALEHASRGARWHAGRRWKELSGRPHAIPPGSAAEALARFHRGELRRPDALLVQHENGWPRIRATEFAEADAA
jgi:DNA repair protein RadD